MRQKIRDALKERIIYAKIIGKIVGNISKLQYSHFFLSRWFGKLLVSPLYFLLKDDYYKLLIFTQKYRTASAGTKSPSRVLPNTFFLKAIAGDKTLTASMYSNLLANTYFSVDTQSEWARRFMEIGRLDLALVGFEELITNKHEQLQAEMRLHILRHLGAVCFMLGNNSKANHYWQLAGRFRRSLFKPTTPKKYRILGPAWYVAIGHVAMLDYYLKFKQLHSENHRIVAQWRVAGTPGEDLLYKFAKMGISLLENNELEQDYNHWAKNNNAPKWKDLSSAEKAALIDDFWEYDFPDGEILGYAHAAARIQREWELAQRAPLFQLTGVEKNWIDDYLANLGVPRGAWYVCLHVRESGFHKQWNSFYPSMRDAEIDDYIEAIKKIVAAGGWVLRMGDPSMKPLPPMRNVIDYAHSFYKTPIADIMLAASCRFFLGTNSGFATVSVIYGVPCALTNWVPIGWPLWPTQDLMIPKLFREKSTGRYLTLEEIFKRKLAFIQNWTELPSDIELVANSVEDITRITQEMLSKSDIENKLPGSHSDAFVAARNHYKQIAEQYDAFTGSQFSSSFIEKHAEVFSYTDTESTETTQGNHLIWQEQLNNNMTVTLN